MTHFRSCHLIVKRNLTDNRRLVCDFTEVDSFRWGGISTLFFKWTPQTLTFFLAITLIWRKR